ncbi:Alpha/beta hydrolase family protein [Marinomonas spartinae]|uniref:alpha/beta family hydrolase n=1 Tax=Marinomonas spartinae TaxID=1792290 RepID=UPI000808E9E7|nr:alpha/beta family hydrolase [Marinomonas spartinae]SBS37990.1 Alpha/beta hydrolase family protein [Marinomonas spartinae]
MKTFPIYLAHGAGVGHEKSTFLQHISRQLEEKVCPVIPVTFAYMREQEATGKKRPPPRFDKLIPEFKSCLNNSGPLIVAGKSMGGRVATQLANDERVKGVICFGFPFHPPGKPEKHRLEFLDSVEVPCLIIQGTRDVFGKPDWVLEQVFNKNIDIVWVEGADHDFKTLKKQAITQEQVASMVASVVERWLSEKFV